jgi:hypothetical protein
MTTHPKPPIFYGAALLATLSLIWSGYAITDLMHSGPFGLSVALAGDIGWLTVLWAEARGVTIAGRAWTAAAAGWLIAVGVAVLLVFHGQDADSTGQTVAGPFVVIVGKIVWAFALAALKDPAAPTAEQRAEVYAVMRESAHESALRHARAEAEIARIRAEARVTLVRDETDFEISVERLEKRAELQRRAPLALTMSARPDSPDTVPDTRPDTSGHPDNTRDTEPDTRPTTSKDTRPDTPNHLQQIAAAASGPADLVRTLSAHGVPRPRLVSEAIRLRPDLNRDSIRRTAKRLGEGPYL